MDQNLPFVSIPFLDKAYNKFIIPILDQLDEGVIFKNIITFLFSLSAMALLIGGLYLTVANVFGDNGYVNKSIDQYGLSALQKAGSSIGLLLGFLMSIVTSWALYSVLKKRTEQLKAMQYEGLLDYVFNKTIPKLILIIGELIFVLFLYVGLLQIIATIMDGYAYAPLQSYPSLMLGFFPGMDLFNGFLPGTVYGTHAYFREYFIMGVSGVALSFVVLIAFYIYKEIYTYMLKLITVFIGFLPKFAIPLAIRKRNEN